MLRKETRVKPLKTTEAPDVGPRSGDRTIASDWFLRTYVTSASIPDAPIDHKCTRQGPDEDENRSSTRLRNAVKHCGTVHSK